MPCFGGMRLKIGYDYGKKQICGSIYYVGCKIGLFKKTSKELKKVGFLALFEIAFLFVIKRKKGIQIKYCFPFLNIPINITYRNLTDF